MNMKGSLVCFPTSRQGLFVAIIVKVRAISDLWSQDYADNVAEAFQNFIICIEMLLFAIAHYFVFSHKPFIDPAAAQAPCVHSCFRMLDVRDVAGDMKEHFVDPISRPSLYRIRRKFGGKSDDAAAVSGTESESEPLIKPAYSAGNSKVSTVGLSDGSLSFSVLTYDQMKVQSRTHVQRTSLTVIEDENRSTSSSDKEVEDKSTDHTSTGSSSDSEHTGAT